MSEALREINNSLKAALEEQYKEIGVLRARVAELEKADEERRAREWTWWREKPVGRKRESIPGFITDNKANAKAIEGAGIEMERLAVRVPTEGGQDE